MQLGRRSACVLNELVLDDVVPNSNARDGHVGTDRALEVSYVARDAGSFNENGAYD